MIKIGPTDYTGMVVMGALVGPPATSAGSSLMVEHAINAFFPSATSVDSTSLSSLKNPEEEVEDVG